MNGMEKLLHAGELLMLDAYGNWMIVLEGSKRLTPSSNDHAAITSGRNGAAEARAWLEGRAGPVAEQPLNIA